MSSLAFGKTAVVETPIKSGGSLPSMGEESPVSGVSVVPSRRKESKRERDRRLEYERRFAVKVWHPKAHDLLLVHLSSEQRAHVRKRLSPWLANLKHANGTRTIGIRGGECWEIAQGLVMTANDSGVKYVEGVWSPWQLVGGGPAQRPLPHAWATVDGHRVDLVCEFYSWQDDSDWVYEPLKEYAHEELAAFADERGGFDDLDISTPLKFRGTCPVIDVPEVLGEGYRDAQEFVFQPAVDRLVARHKKGATDDRQ